MTKELKNRYSRIAITLHWAMAVLILCMVGFGWTLDDLSGTALSQSLSYHATGGILVATLLALRFMWRIGNPPPPSPETLSKSQRIASKYIHTTLYVLILLVPTTGLVTAVSHEVSVVIFGDVDLQNIFSFFGRDNFAIKRGIHANAVYLLLVLIIGHVAAALVHKFWFKDTIMDRMLFRKSS